MFRSIFIDGLFVLSVVVIWFMLAYQFVLCLLGWLYSHRAAREGRELAARNLDLPRVSLLIPAHNEEVVLEHTLAAMAALNYPAGALEIIVINDASKDQTGAIADRWAAKDPRIRVMHLSQAERAGGKSAALNKGMRLARFEAIAIYDADNTPEPDALLHLARQLAVHPELGAVIGLFRCVNRKKNLLTRLINIEGLSYQWIVQAGRWMLMRVCTLPGTNLIIRRPILEKLGGWDSQALTEDAELSYQIYEAGHRINLVSAAYPLGAGQQLPGGQARAPFFFHPPPPARFRTAVHPEPLLCLLRGDSAFRPVIRFGRVALGACDGGRPVLGGLAAGVGVVLRGGHAGAVARRGRGFVRQHRPERGGLFHLLSIVDTRGFKGDL